MPPNRFDHAARERLRNLMRPMVARKLAQPHACSQPLFGARRTIDRMLNRVEREIELAARGKRARSVHCIVGARPARIARRARRFARHRRRSLRRRRSRRKRQRRRRHRIRRHNRRAKLAEPCARRVVGERRAVRERQRVEARQPRKQRTNRRLHFAPRIGAVAPRARERARGDALQIQPERERLRMRFGEAHRRHGLAIPVDVLRRADDRSARRGDPRSSVLRVRFRQRAHARPARNAAQPEAARVGPVRLRERRRDAMQLRERIGERAFAAGRFVEPRRLPGGVCVRVRIRACARRGSTGRINQSLFGSGNRDIRGRPSRRAMRIGLGRLGRLGRLSHISHISHISRLSRLSRISHISLVSHFHHLNHLNHLNRQSLRKRMHRAHRRRVVVALGEQRIDAPRGRAQLRDQFGRARAAACGGSCIVHGVDAIDQPLQRPAPRPHPRHGRRHRIPMTFDEIADDFESAAQPRRAARLQQRTRQIAADEQILAALAQQFGGEMRRRAPIDLPARARRRELRKLRVQRVEPRVGAHVGARGHGGIDVRAPQHGERFDIDRHARARRRAAGRAPFAHPHSVSTSFASK
ncbi:hypothetical protein DP43_5284 [Burkholderia pseudomallei]|nr:hypothetical protein DP43_5284 [Burkholderia pseudomallei]